MDVALRLDLKTDQDVPNLTAYLDSLGGSYWIVREGENTNPHVHVHFRGDVTLKAFRSGLVRRFPNHVGNGGYSVKQCDADVEGYDRYMAKGESIDEQPIIIARQGIAYSLDVITQWHQDYWDINVELNKKRRKKLKGSVADQLLQRCRNKGINKKGLIGREYIAMIKEANLSLNIFAGRAAINTVWLHQCADDTAESCILNDLVGEHALDV